MRDVSSPPEQLSFLFRAVVALAAVFCMTIFAMVAAMVSDSGSPVVRFLNDHGGTIIAIEVAAILIVAIGAMFADRWKTLREMRETGESDQLHPPDAYPSA